jgi:hypothetical protein
MWDHSLPAPHLITQRKFVTAHMLHVSSAPCMCMQGCLIWVANQGHWK